MSIFNAINSGAMKGALDGLSKRHEAISNNLANVDTPGYKRETVSFREELAKAVGGKNELNITNKRHISVGSGSLESYRPSIKKERDSSVRIDKNNVNIDVEMSNLAKTDLEYQAITKQIANQFERLDSVIQRGGR